MPTDSMRVPAYRHHKPSGQAVVTLDGRDIYLGVYRSAASKAEYSRITGEWLTAGRRLPSDPDSVTIAEVVTQYRKHAKGYYRHPDGTPTSEIDAVDAAIVPLLKLYGKTTAGEFDSLRLMTTRDEMIRMGWSRKSINKHVHRLQRIFKWAAAQKLVNASVWHSLVTVVSLKANRSAARETEPIKPVPDGYVEAVTPHLSRQVQTMILLQQITGMRPGEVVAMRTGDIDRTGDLWVFRPEQHKGLHRGHDREIYLGPKAQEVVKPFLKLDPGAFLFDPRDAEAERREKQHERRKTPLKYGNRPGSNRKAKPKRTIGNRYDVAAYRRAITRACAIAFPPPEDASDEDKKKWIAKHHWHPHQLRHSAATDLRKRFGIEAAQVMLGHRTLDVTELYAEKNIDAAKRIAAQVG